MKTAAIARYRTALNRREMSRPIRLALEDSLITNDVDVFDYGCGRGEDIRQLASRGISCTGWDPNHRPEGERSSADVVNLGYVINVIEDSSERVEVLRSAWNLARKLLIVSARLSVEAKNGDYVPYEDGCITSRATFQKYYEQHELRSWIDKVLEVQSVPVAPGIFYVFRDPNLQQGFIASRYRRTSAAPRQRLTDDIFEEYKSLLQPLMKFVALRGRLPDKSELDVWSEISSKIGSLKRAFSIIRKVTGGEQWEQIRAERSQDLLIYLALSRFGGRPRISQLPFELQLDVRAFFSTYSQACSQADELLFSAGKLNLVDDACRTSTVGKLTHSALYVHTSALPYLPPVLRVYEGCARAYIGAVEGANVIKLHRGKPQVSYLAYPEFETDPHPTLFASLTIPLKTFHIYYREYADTKNPPILHRKENFLSANHLLHEKFARLTRQEEHHHLYEQPELIGTREGWQQELDKRGLHLRGHRLFRKPIASA
jgi:DNA phosphorothioation-associated putative methyltransferase